MIKNNILQNLKKISLAFLIISLFSCAKQNANQTPEVRIVNLQGKPGKVVTKFPQLNVDALKEQGRLMQAQRFNQQISNQALQRQNYQNKSAGYSSSNNSQNLETRIIEDGTIRSQDDVLKINSVQQSLAYPQNPDMKNLSQKKEVTEYNLNDNSFAANEVEKNSVKKAVVNIKKKAAKKSSGKTYSLKKKQYYIQVGSFKNESNAKRHLQDMSKYHKGKIEELNKNSMHRVILGPFAKRYDANKLLKKVKNSGQSAILIRSN